MPWERCFLSEIRTVHLQTLPAPSPHLRRRLWRQLRRIGPLQPLLARARATILPTDHLCFRSRPPRSFASDGSSPSNADPTRPGDLKIMTTNLWHDWPRFRRRKQRLERFASLAQQRRVDILLLQEVTRVADCNTAQWLADRLQMAFVYGRANGSVRGAGFEEGLAILSRFPLAGPDLHQLSSNAPSLIRRLALTAVAHTPFGPLALFNVHLGHGKRSNTRQLAGLQRWVAAVPPTRPALIGGDFNAGENTPRMRRLRLDWVDLFRQAQPHADGATHALHWPWGSLLYAQRLDYLFLRPTGLRWQVLEALHLQPPGQPISDHRPVFVRMTPD